MAPVNFIKNAIKMPKNASINLSVSTCFVTHNAPKGTYDCFDRQCHFLPPRTYLSADLYELSLQCALTFKRVISFLPELTLLG